MADEVEAVDSYSAVFVQIVKEVVTSPLNLILLGVCCVLVYKLVAGRRGSKPIQSVRRELPLLKKRDFTLEQLRQFDGKQGQEEEETRRILLAVNGKVFDVTRGSHFYGPGKPYGFFAGRDASRALATFSLDADAFKDEYDDLSDLTSVQMSQVREWEMQMTEKYDYVGKLLKPGEQPTDYTDSEDEQSEEKREEEKPKDQ